MTAAVESLLSRDEMDALLDELATARRDEGRGAAGRGDSHAALARALEEFAEGYSKRLSTAHQRRIDWIVRETARIEPRDAVEIASPGELFWVFESTAGGSAWLSWSRSLIFAWLQVAFGAPEPRGLAPERPYTAIERSFLSHLARDTVAALAESLSSQGFAPAEGGALHDSRDLLAFGTTPFVQTRFEVRGFGDLGQLRLALPAAGVSARVSAPGGAAAAARRHGHRGAVFGAPVSLRAELGSTEISVEALARLRAGDVLPLRTASDGSLLLKVGDAPKFRALRGAVGERLAVQVTERIGESR